MLNTKFYFLVLVAVLAMSCSPGDDAGHVELSDLVGLWNSSENNAGISDLMYTRITDNGAIIEYDFDGDDFDQGLACYQIESGTLKPLTANRFLVTADMHAGQQFEVELELLDNGHALKVYFLDRKDPSITLESQIWTREPDASILDKEPSCKP